jgi:phosphoribosylaminoimidazole carboxylase PurE protein
MPRTPRPTAPAVGILMGSDSDLPSMDETLKVLREFAVPYEVHVASAHRTPARVMQFAAEAEGRGLRVLIAAAGGAAHLAGVVAAHTVLPVIGVPMEGGSLLGLDALLSTVQMPAGIPVACVAIGKAGARNAGLLAVEILALSDAGLRQALHDFRERLAAQVAEKDRKLQSDHATS